MPGKEYILTQYARGFGEPDGRQVNVETSDDGAVTLIDQNLNGDQQGCMIMYSYTAPASGELTLNYSADNPADTWHHYAFSNELDDAVYLEPQPLPAEEITIYDTLSWILFGNIENLLYDLKIASDPSMSNIVELANGLTVNSYAPNLVPETVYYWQVDVFDQGTKIHSSPVWSFTTLPVPPDAVKLLEWKFDEQTGTIAEQTGILSNADGILVGFDYPDVSHVDGLANNGLYLNGKDEYIDISSAYSYMPTADGQSFAVSGYIRTFDDYGPLFSMRNSSSENPIIDITLGADGIQIIPGRLCLLVRDDTGSISWVNSGMQVNDGLWHHILVNRVGSNWTLLIDGIPRAAIDDAASGNVDLDMMAMGTSLRWIADNWQPHNSHFRDFKGILDEFTVWDGQLQPHQIDELVAVLPETTDLDYDQDADIEDLTMWADHLLENFWIPTLPIAVLEDMETYSSGGQDHAQYWPYVPESGYGDLVLSILDDPDGLYRQVMQMDYDFSNGALHAHVPVKLINRGMDMSLYGQVSIVMQKLYGCDVSKIILGFYDGRDKADPAGSDLYEIGRIEFDITNEAEGNWITLTANIPENLKYCTDLYQINFSIEDGGGDIGSLYIDSIFMTDQVEDCVPTVFQILYDFNSDCTVDLNDFSEFADNWISQG